MVNPTHSAEPFETSEPLAWKWTTQAFDGLTAGSLTASIRRRDAVRIAEVSGACPRCLGPLDWTMPLDGVAGTAGSLGASERSIDTYVSLDVPCDCGIHHTGGPTGSTGCGITFRIDVRENDNA